MIYSAKPESFGQQVADKSKQVKRTQILIVFYDICEELPSSKCIEKRSRGGGGIGEGMYTSEEYSKIRLKNGNQ